MNKKCLASFVCALLCLFLSAMVHADAPLPDTIDVGILAHCPPLYATDDNGKPFGFIIDMMDALSEAAGLRLNYKSFEDWPRLLEAARGGEILVVPGVNISDEGNDLFDFTTAYELSAIRIFVSARISGINCLEDLGEKKIAVVNTCKARFFLEQRGGLNLAVYPTIQEALVSLLSGKTHALISQEGLMLHLIRDADLEEHVKATGPPVLEEKRGLGVIKNHPELLRRLDAAVTRFRAAPVSKAIYLKWYGKPKPFWNTRRFMRNTTFVFVGVVFLLLLSRYVSVRKLNNRLRKTSAECTRIHQELRRTQLELEDRVRQRTMELEKIRNSMEKAQAVAGFGNWDWDLVADSIWCSDGIYCILGLQLHEPRLSYEEFLQRVHPEDIAFVRESVNLAMASKQSLSLEHRLIYEDGTVRTVAEEAEIIRDETGKAVRMIGVLQDVTEKRSTEATLKLNEERLETLFHLSQMDNVSKKTLANYALESAVKMTSSKGGYLHFYDEETQTIYVHLWSVDVRHECRAEGKHHFQIEPDGIWSECVRRRQPVIHDNECNIPSAAGYPPGHFPIGRHMAIPVLVDDRIVVIAGVCNKETPYDGSDMQQLTLLMNEAWGIIHKKEITAEKNELTNLLRHAQKMEAIGTLAGGIAHDFNNILTPILGYTDMIRDDAPPDSPQWHNLTRVIQAGKRAKELVQQILAFSRQSEEDHKPVQIHLVVKETMKLLRASIPSTIEIQQGIDADCGFVLADPTQIHQIVMNLCTNAYHAMLKTDGILRVGLGNTTIPADDPRLQEMRLAPGNFVMLEVSDTGIGMDRATMDKMFDPYFTTKEKGEGTGLGLAVVHGIVKNMSGSITVHSELGKGTTFRIFLPRVLRGAIFDRQAKRPLPQGNEKIMIVEDEESIAVMEKQMLESLGYTVSAMHNGVDALREFSAGPEKYDLVITDMSMPGMNGDELALRIMALRPGMPIILCTGFSEIIDKDRARALGIQKFVMKPVVRRELGEIVRNVLDGTDGRLP